MRRPAVPSPTWQRSQEGRTGRKASPQREAGTSHLLGLDQHHVVAGLWTRVAAAGQGQQAGLSAGGAGPGVAAVGLPGRVVAGRRTPEDAESVLINVSQLI